MATPRSRANKGNNLGVLLTGYCMKAKPRSSRWKRRFLVLTRDVLHWYKRQEGSSLFGVLKGKVNLDQISEIIPLEDPQARKFEIKTEDGRRRWFQMESSDSCFLWVDALSKTTDEIHEIGFRGSSFADSETSADDTEDEGSVMPPMLRSREGTLSELNFFKDDDNIDEPEVVLVSVGTRCRNSEEVWDERVCRKGLIPWGTTVDVPLYNPQQDQMALMMTTGEIVTITSEELMQALKNFATLKLPVGRGCIEIRVTAAGSALMTFSVSTPNASFTRDAAKTTASFQRAWDCLLCVNDDAADQSGRHRRSMQGSAHDAITLKITLLAYQFEMGFVASAELPPIPQRFIDGCFQDMAEAKRRWIITHRWRKKEQVDDLLYQPQPFFHVIKKYYPHFYHGRGRSGGVAYYERLGFVDFDSIMNEGATLNDMVRHIIFLQEYRWNILCDSENSTEKTISIIDVKNMKISDCGGDAMELLKRSSVISQEHYPETLEVMMIINCPTWFNMIWRVVKQFINEVTLKKVRIANEKNTFATLNEFLDANQIPVEYGGKGKFGDGSKDSYRFQHPMELDLARYVNLHNNELSP